MASLEEFVDVGKAPLTAPLENMSALKELPEYDRISVEIAKIGSLQGGAGTISWPNVAKNAATVLSQYAKDIPAATYFSVALAETDGLRGLCVGWRVLYDVIDTWWESASPPLKRLRARVNSVDWWHERIKAFLNRSFDPIEQDLQTELLALTKDFDALVGERLEDCQPFYDIREAIQRLVVIAPPPEVVAEVAEVAEVKEPAASPAAPVVAPVAAPVVAPVAQAAPAPAPTPAVASAPAVDTHDDNALQKSTQILLQSARQHYDIAFAHSCPTDALAWEALYMSVWGHIKALPPTENGQSMVPAPDENRVASVRTLAEAGNDAHAVRAAALLAPASPFCFDLHTIMADCLSRLGGRYAEALAVLEQKSRSFFNRFAGIERIQFADGTPFAGATTLAWIEHLSTAREGGGGVQDSAVTGLVDEARGLAGQKQLAKALSVLHEGRLGMSAADTLRLQLAQARLLVQHKAFAVVSPLAQHILDVLDTHKLDLWDNALCLEALVVVHSVWGKSHPDKAALVLERIALLDPAKALTLAPQ